MWRWFNFFFGWHYVWVKDLGQYHICRVKMQPNGDLSGKIVNRSFSITKEGKISGGYLIEDWHPLTTEQEKTNDLKNRNKE